MAHLSNNMPDARMVPPHQHMMMESPAGSVLAPLSTTTSSQPTALRRASYIRVADLVKSFNVDADKLKDEIDKLNNPDCKDAPAKSTSDEVSDDATGKGKNATEATETEAESGTETPENVAEISDASASLSKLRLGSSKENVSEEQFRQRGKTFRKRLQPPSSGYNLCLLVGSVDVVVDKLRVDRSRVRLAEVMVGDETGCVYLRARDKQIDTLKEISDSKGAVVLRNATIEVFQGRFLRLAITKWGKISSFPDQVASTPSPPKAINESTNFSAINLNLVVKEISVPSSPEGGGNEGDSPSSSSQQQLSTAESSRYRKPSRGESFDDSRSTRSYASTTSRSKGRKGQRKQNQQYQYNRSHGGKPGVVHPQGSPTSQPYPAPYPGVYAGIPIQGMSSFPAAAAMYSHSSQGGSPELPPYTYPAQKTGQVYSAQEAEHHRKHQALIAQQYELQQRHHYQQMQLFQQQQENHQRLLQAQQQQFSSPRLTPGTRKGDAPAMPSSSLPASAFPPMEGSPTRAMPMFDHGVPAHATPVSPPTWPGGHEQTPPTSPMNPRARTFAPTHDQIQSPQIPYAMYDPSLQHHASGTSSATPVAAAAYGSPLSNHQLYSQVAATMPYIPPMQEGSPPDETQQYNPHHPHHHHHHQHQGSGPPKSK